MGVGLVPLLLWLSRRLATAFQRSPILQRIMDDLVIRKNALKGLKLRKTVLEKEKHGRRGYEYLGQSLGLTAFEPQRPALVKPGDT